MREILVSRQRVSTHLRTNSAHYDGTSHYTT